MKVKVLLLLLVAGVVVCLSVTLVVSGARRSRNALGGMIGDTLISADGKYAAFVYEPPHSKRWNETGSPALVVDINSGEIVAQTEPGVGAHDYMSGWLNDGSVVVFGRFTRSECASPPYLVMTLSLRDGTTSQLGTQPEGWLLEKVQYLSTGRMVCRATRAAGLAGARHGMFLGKIDQGHVILEPLVTDRESHHWTEFWIVPRSSPPRLVAEEKEFAFWAGAEDTEYTKTTYWEITLVDTEETSIRPFGQELPGITYGADLSPDGLHIAVVLRGEDGPNEVLLMARDPSMPIRRIRPREDVFRVKWSPDSSAIVAWRSAWRSPRLTRGAVIIINARNLSTRAFWGGRWWPMSDSVKWLPEGRTILIGSGESLWTVDLEKGRRRKIWSMQREP